MPLFDRPPAHARAPHAAAFGLVCYCALVGALLVFGTRLAVQAVTVPRKPLTFVSLAIAPPSVSVTVPRPVREDIPPPRVEPLPTPAPPPPPPPEAKPPEPTPVVKPPAAVPQPPKPQVKVGAFDSQPVDKTPVAPPKQIQATAFETASVAQSTVRNQTVATGAFESIAGGKPTGPAPGAAVTPGGFDRPASNGVPGAARGQVVTTGFDSTPTGPARPSTAATVRASAFGDTPQPATQVREVKQATSSTPVEVLYKPTPGYTDDARAQKIQGTVLLEVEFTAAGEVRVLNVVRGLGHGLDEIARQVATSMRFRPATQDGRPVDSRATVQIVFRLT